MLQYVELFRWVRSEAVSVGGIAIVSAYTSIVHSFTHVCRIRM